MKLYVALAIFDYEGSDIIGVFDSEEVAQQACDNHRYKDGSFRGDSREVEEYELNEAELVTL
jgi:hypothetical protein